MHVKGLVLESTVDYVVQIIIIGAYSFSMTVMACMLKGFKNQIIIIPAVHISFMALTVHIIILALCNSRS